jgi:hypothetical protein
MKREIINQAQSNPMTAVPGSEPPTAGMQAMDFAIVGMLAGTIILVVKTWGWILFS